MVVSSRRASRLIVAAAWLSLACSSSIPERSLEVDCSVNDDYELITLQPMEGTMASWFNFGDATPGGVNLVEVRPIPEGRCDSTAALVVTVNGHTDWGAGFGEYQTAMAAVDASEYEGISFWARATGYGTSTGFLFTVNDKNTYALEQDPGAVDQAPVENGPVCTVPVAEDTVDGAYMVNEAGMVVPVGGELPAANDCGNGFVRVVNAQREWHLHRLPFESFQQQALPNRKPGGIDTSGLYQFAINIPKDSNIELWIDDLGIYRRRQPPPPTVAGGAEQ